MIGYARVCTPDPNLDLQIDACPLQGARRSFAKKITGSREERPEFSKALEALREGDTLVVLKLGRSLKKPVDLVDELYKQGILFKSLTDAIDSGISSGSFFFHVMASLVQLERELTVERIRAGLETARKLGRKGGRKWRMNDGKIESAKRLLANGMPPET